MKIRVKLFAVARQLAARDEVELALPAGATVGLLRAELAARVPALAPLLERMRFAVDADYATDATALQPASDVACIPPVSGG